MTGTSQFNWFNAKSMPHRLLHYLAPSDPPSGPVLAVQLGVSALLAWISASAAWIGGLPISVQVFIWAMAADYLSGLYACGKSGDKGFFECFSWRAGIEGILRKGLIGLISLIMWQICGLIGPSAELLASGLTYLFAINEGTSVVKNLRKGKYEIPPIIDEVLARARRQYETQSGAPPSPIVIEVRKDAPDK